MLNPETISDSPSAVSKGVRFLSAKQSTIQIINNNGTQTISGRDPIRARELMLYVFNT